MPSPIDEDNIANHRSVALAAGQDDSSIELSDSMVEEIAPDPNVGGDSVSSIDLMQLLQDRNSAPDAAEPPGGASAAGWDPLESSDPDPTGHQEEVPGQDGWDVVGITGSARRHKSRGWLWLLSLALVASATGGYLWYRARLQRRAQWEQLRVALHEGTSSSLERATQIAKRLVDGGSPQSKAALALCAAIYSIELGEDRRETATALLQQTKDSDSEWRTATRAYLELLGPPAQAVGYLQKAVESAPKNAILLYLKGRALARAEQPEAAAKSYRQALRLRPGYTAAQIRLALLIAHQGDAYATALELVDSILRSNKKSTAALVARARINSRLGKALGQAAEDARQVASGLAAAASRLELAWAHLIIARGLRQQGDVAAMTKALDTAVKAPPCCDASFRAALARQLMDVFRYDEAMQQMKAAHSLSPDRGEYLLLLSQLALENGQLSLSRGFLGKVDTKLVAARVMRARLALAQGQYRVAKRHFDQLGAANTVPGRVFAAVTVARLGDMSAAQSALRQLSRTRPNDYLPWMVSGQLYLAAHVYDKAEVALRRAWRLNGLQPKTPTLLGWVALRTRRLGTAEKRFRTALRLNASFAPALIGLSELQLRAGQLSKARQRLEQIERRDRADYQLMACRIAIAGGDLPGAEHHIDQARAAGASTADLDQWRGALALARGQVRRAIRLLSAARAAKPRNVELLIALGQANYRDKRDAEAFDTYELALRYDPTNAEALLGLAQILVDDRDFPEATRRLNQALRASKRDHQPTTLRSRVFFELGRVYLKQRDTGRAIASFQDAIELNPDAGRPYLQLGLTYELLERPRRALEQYEKALSKDPQLLSAHLAAARNCAKVGEAAKAVSHAQQYLKRAPKRASGRREAKALLKRLGA